MVITVNIPTPMDPLVRVFGPTRPLPSMGFFAFEPSTGNGPLAHVPRCALGLPTTKKETNAAALHTSAVFPVWNNQGHSRAFWCVFTLGGEMNGNIYNIVIQTEKTGAPALCCASFGSPQTKTHVDLINEYQSPKRRSTCFNMVQHPVA